MIIACPECKTRYVVAPAAIGKDGRLVKCSKCAHTWFEEAPPEVPEIVPEKVVEEKGGEKDKEAMEKREPGSGPESPLKKNVPALVKEHSAGLVFGWILLAVLVLGGGFSLYFFRTDLEKASPAIGNLYEKWDYLVLGKEPPSMQPPPPVVEVIPHPASFISMRQAYEIRMVDKMPSLVITLDMQNDGDKDVDLPAMIGVIRDKDGNELFTWTQVLVPSHIPAKGYQQYEITVDKIPAASTQATLTFEWPK